MFAHIFKARNSEGVLISGVLTADSRDTIAISLKKKGYYPISVERQNRLSAVFQKNAAFHVHISVKEKAIFTHQLAVLLRAGMHLSVALKTLSKQTDNKYLASVIKQLHIDIEQSASLSEAMAKHSKVFTSVYVAIVEAAEKSGSLAETLFILSKQLKSQAVLNGRIKGAIAYPIFLLCVSFAAVVVLITFVIPKFINLFVNAKQTLPLPTKVLIYITNSAKEFWWVLLIVITALICFILAALKTRHVRLYIDDLLLRLPIVGTFNKKLQLARFARVLGSLIRGGVKIISAISTTKTTTANTAFSREIGKIKELLLKGSSLAKAMKQQSFFNEVVANMVAVGESTGALPEMLLEIADLYDQEFESAINSMTSLLGPLMIVILGLIIGFVVMAILLPVFGTASLIS